MSEPMIDCQARAEKPEAALAALEKKCAQMREALLAVVQCPACGGDGVFHPECQSCLSGEPERCTCTNEPAQACPVCEGTEKAIYDKMKRALSTDCGKGFVRLEELQPTLDLLRKITGGDPGDMETVHELDRLEALVKGAEK